ncbi:MAG: flagellin [Nitrospirae bacterium]|nr:flagellin [Nitrospirota bacterium]
MPLIVNTNIASLNTQRQLELANQAIGKSLERLSSGLRINRAADDPAGLAIATRLQAQVRGLQQASRNANNAISLVQTAEGALNSVTDILQRLRELAVQAASDDNTDTDRIALNNEASQLRDELTRLANTVEFNGTTLLDGTFSGKKFQIGANADQTLTFAIADVRATAIGQFASQSVNIADGIATPTSDGVGNLSAGEFSINSTDVLATSDSDDQLSVVAVGGESLAAALSGATYADSLLSASLNINGTNISLSGLSGTTTGAFATDVASLINAANITDVTARVLATSLLVIEAGGGTNLVLGADNTGATAAQNSSAAGIASTLGLGSAFIGSTGSTSAITTYNGQSSSLAKAASVNGVRSTTGVSANVEENSLTFTSSVATTTITSGDFFINGVNIGAVSVSTNDSNGALAAAINAQSTNTGVKATVSSGKLTLNAQDGRNITISAVSAVQTGLGNTGADLTFTGVNAIERGSLTLTSTGNFTVAGTTTDFGSIAATTFVASGNLSTLAVTSRTSANTAITQIDSALDTINTSRSSIGAVQSRLQIAINFLANAAENQAASESRIRDADFAFETAQFTRAQILVQAATAILAQANAQPQVALQLLQ